MSFGTFGTPAPTANTNTTSLFGNPPQQQQQQQQQQPSDLAPSSRAAKWAISQLNDVGASAADGGRYLAISLMDTYRPYSFEELRHADYSRSDKGGEHAPNQQSVFGAPTPQPQQQQQQSLFGAPPAQQQSQSSLFGGAQPQSQASLFGQPQQPQSQSSLFGQPQAQGQSQSSSLFGQPQSQSSLFGQPQQAQSQSSLFGQPQQAPPQSQPSLFGQPQTPAQAQSQPSLFGQPQQAPPQSQPSLFGQPQAQPQSQPSLFGQQPQPQSSLFGGGGVGVGSSQTQQSLFGSGTTPQPSSSTPSLSLFGNTTATTAASTSLFSNATPSLFNTNTTAANPTSAPSLFGAQQPQSAPSLLFGASSATTPSLFSAAPVASNTAPSLFGQPQPQPTLFASNITHTNNSLFGNNIQQPQQLQLQPQQNLQISLTNNPFGLSNLITGASTSSCITSGNAANTTRAINNENRIVVATTTTQQHNLSNNGVLINRNNSGFVHNHGWYKASPMRPWGREGSLFNSNPHDNNNNMITNDKTNRPFSWGGVGINQNMNKNSATSNAFQAPWRTEEQMLKAANIKKLIIEPLPAADDINSTRRNQRSSERFVPASTFDFGNPNQNDQDQDQDEFQLHGHMHSNIKNNNVNDDGGDDEVYPKNLIERRSIRLEREKEKQELVEKETEAETEAEGEGDGEGETETESESMTENGVENSNYNNNDNKDVVDVDHNDDNNIDDDEVQEVSPQNDDENKSIANSQQDDVNQSHPLKQNGSTRNARIVSYSEVYRDHLMGSSNQRRVSLGDKSTMINLKEQREQPQQVEQEEQPQPQQIAPISIREDAYLKPTIQEMEQMSETELQNVQGLVYGIYDIGEIQWLENVNVTGINFDKVIKIIPREVSVYPPERGLKVPNKGEGLNVPANVKLHGIWKHDKRSKRVLKDATATANIVARLKRHCDNEGLTFLGYEVRSGTWTFRTNNF